MKLWKLPPLPFRHSAYDPRKSPDSTVYRCAICLPYLNIIAFKSQESNSQTMPLLKLFKVVGR